MANEHEAASGASAAPDTLGAETTQALEASAFEAPTPRPPDGGEAASSAGEPAEGSVRPEDDLDVHAAFLQTVERDLSAAEGRPGAPASETETKTETKTETETETDATVATDAKADGTESGEGKDAPAGEPSPGEPEEPSAWSDEELRRLSDLPRGAPTPESTPDAQKAPASDAASPPPDAAVAAETPSPDAPPDHIRLGRPTANPDFAACLRATVARAVQVGVVNASDINPATFTVEEFQTLDPGLQDRFVQDAENLQTRQKLLYREQMDDIQAARVTTLGRMTTALSRTPLARRIDLRAAENATLARAILREASMTARQSGQSIEQAIEQTAAAFMRLAPPTSAPASSPPRPSQSSSGPTAPPQRTPAEAQRLAALRNAPAADGGTLDARLTGPQRDAIPPIGTKEHEQAFLASVEAAIREADDRRM